MSGDMDQARETIMLSGMMQSALAPIKS